MSAPSLAQRAGEGWRSNLAIRLDHKGAQHKLQFHHIFPKAVLKGHYTDRDADDIANLAFIGGKMNRSISDKPPAAYFPGVLEKAGADAFAAQSIPLDEALLQVDGYKLFLSQRRKSIAERVNTFLGTRM